MLQFLLDIIIIENTGKVVTSDKLAGLLNRVVIFNGVLKSIIEPLLYSLFLRYIFLLSLLRV